MNLMRLYHVFIVIVQTAASNDLILEFLAQNNQTACIFLVSRSKCEKNKLQKLVTVGLSIRIAFPSLDDSGICKTSNEAYGRVSYILDLTSMQSKAILEQCSATGKFRFIYSWLLIHDESIMPSKIKDLLIGIKLRADMNMKVAIPDSTGTYYQIFEVYKLGLEVDIVIREVGIFRNKIFSFMGNATFYEARKNMSGVLIRNTNTVDYSFDTDEDLAINYRTSETGNHGKFYFQIYRNLIGIHQFHYNTTLSTAWFGNTTNGYDAGFGKLLFDDTVDFNSAGGILRPARVYYYDFVLPYTEFRNCFFYRTIGTAKPGLGVLKPFTTQTWYAAVAIALVMCLAIKMALWIEYTFFKYNVKYSFVTIVVTAISIFAQQGSHILPKQIGGRLIFLNLLVLSILLYNYYTSSLVSSLLSSKPNSFTTIEELVESNLRAGIEYTPYAITYILQQQDDDAVRRLNSTKLYETGKPNYFPPRDGIALVKKGGFAYHTDAIRAYPLIAMTYEEDIICDLAQIDFVTPGYLGFMLQKNSQYSELMKISLTKMLSSGILDREKKFWNPRKPECALSARVVAVGMKELALVYVIIVAGMITSLLTLAVEMIWFRLLDNEDKYSRRKQFNSVYLHSYQP